MTTRGRRPVEEAVRETRPKAPISTASPRYLAGSRGRCRRALEESLGAERPPASGKARVRPTSTASGRASRGARRRRRCRSPRPRLDLRFPGEPPRWEGQLGFQAAYDSNPGVLAEDTDGGGAGQRPG